METITVAAGKVVAVGSAGYVNVAKGGETIRVPKFFATQLKRDGIAEVQEEEGEQEGNGQEEGGQG